MICAMKTKLEQAGEQKQDWEAVNNFKLDCYVVFFEKSRVQKIPKEMEGMSHTGIWGKKEVQAERRDKARK